MRCVWILLFMSEFSVIRLSVYMVVVLFSVCRFPVYSSALTIASCSAYLLVHFLFNLYFRIFMCVPDLNMVTSAPTRCSELYLLVNIWTVLVSSLFSVWNFIVSAGDANNSLPCHDQTVFHFWATCWLVGRIDTPPLFSWLCGSILSVCIGLHSTPYSMPSLF